MVTYIKTDGTKKVIKDKINLGLAKHYVDGWVEVVRLRGGSCLLVNEEGLLHRMIRNQVATQMAGKLIVGNVLLMEGADAHDWY